MRGSNALLLARRITGSGMSAEQVKLIHRRYPAANLRLAYVEGYDHPEDPPEDHGHSIRSPEHLAFRDGQWERKKGTM